MEFGVGTVASIHLVVAALAADEAEVIRLVLPAIVSAHAEEVVVATAEVKENRLAAAISDVIGSVVFGVEAVVGIVDAGLGVGMSKVSEP